MISRQVIIIFLLALVIFILVLLLMNQKIFSSKVINKENFSNKHKIKGTNHKNIVFTSAGDNTLFDTLWLDKNRNYDVWVVYYGDNDDIYNKYKNKVDYIEKRKGSKFQNFYHIYNTLRGEIDRYERFFILDDDIIFKTDDINKMFDISEKYNLWLCQPSFDPKGKTSAGSYLLNNNPDYLLRYTNFVEVGVGLFNKKALDDCLKYYDPILIGWGVDYLFSWVINPNKNKKRMAVIDEIICLNPYDNTHGKDKDREHHKIKNYDKEILFWNRVQKRYRIPEWKGVEYFKDISIKN